MVPLVDRGALAAGRTTDSTVRRVGAAGRGEAA
jgi:hypothetical protein